MSNILKGLQLNELSNDKLGDYKTAAGADATAADKAGDYKRGNKRVSGIIKATKKEFANDKKKKDVTEDFEDMPDELMDPQAWKALDIRQKYKALFDAGLVKPGRFDYVNLIKKWMNDDGTNYPLDHLYAPTDLRDGKLDLNKIYRSAQADYQGRTHSSNVTSQDREHELNIGSEGRAESKRKADELVELKREKLRTERLHDEQVAFQRAETVQQRKDEMQKIADKYKQDLTVIDKEHRNNMEAIKTNNTFELDKLDKEYKDAQRERDFKGSETDKEYADAQRERDFKSGESDKEFRDRNADRDFRSGESDKEFRDRNQDREFRSGESDKDYKDRQRERQHQQAMADKEREQSKPEPEEEPSPRPRPQRPNPGAGNKFDQDTGEPIRPQSNQWHTNQQLSAPTKPSKPNKNDDVTDVELKPNKPLALGNSVKEAGTGVPFRGVGGASAPQKPLMAVSLDKWKEAVLKRYPEARFMTQKMINGATIASDRTGQVGIYDPKNSYAKVGPETQQGGKGGQVYGQPQWQMPNAPSPTYTPGKPMPQSLQQKLDGKPNTGRAVDVKGRTQQQWVKLVKAKFPDAKIMQSKMIDGPSFAMLSDGRKLSWNKVEQDVAESHLTEFAPVGGDDREPNEEEILRQLAAKWWLGTEQEMSKAQKTLAAMGWDIGQDESGDDDAGVFVIRAGDENGDSYIAFNHSELEKLNEAFNNYHANRTGFTRGTRDDERHDLDTPTQVWGLKINGKVWSKGGKDVTFTSKQAALNTRNAILKNKPDLEIGLVTKGGVAEETMNEGVPSDNDMGVVPDVRSGTSTKMTLGQWKQMWLKKMPHADQGMFRYPPAMNGSFIAYFDGWENTPGARWDPQQSVSEEQLDELKCWPGHHRVAGTKAGFPGSCAKNKKTNEEGIAEKIDSRFRKTEWIPIPDALKILKHYGATIEEWGGHFHFAYYDREGVRKRIEDLTWNADDTRNVRLSILNQAVRELKAQKQGVAEEQHSCPHCGGEMVNEELMNEKKDACYYKVKSRYKVWPSAYASGALVKCRNKGASNWGNGGKKNESSILEGINRVEESLHDWFNKEKWVRMDTKGNIKGPCAKEPGEGKPKCLPQAKAHSLGKKGRASAAARKRREDPNPERSGKAINVNTKKRSNENIDEDWKKKLGAAALAGSMALGAAGASADTRRVTPDGQGGFTGGLKPTATVVAPDNTPSATPPTSDPFKGLVRADSADRQAKTITVGGKEYGLVEISPTDIRPRSGKQIVVPQAVLGERGIGTYMGILTGNTVFVISK